MDKDLKDIIERIVVRAGSSAIRKAGEIAKPHVVRAKANLEWKQIPGKLAAQEAREARERQRDERLRHEAERARQVEAQNKVLAQALQDDQRRRDVAKQTKAQAASALVTAARPPVPSPVRTPSRNAAPSPASGPASMPGPAPGRKR